MTLTLRLSPAMTRRRQGLFTMNCNEKVFCSRTTGRQHRLYDNAMSRCIVGGYDDVMVRAQRAPDGRLYLIGTNSLAVDKNRVAPINTHSRWSIRRHLLRATRRQVHLYGVKSLHGERRQHESRQQKEHDVDHRNDFDATALRSARATKLHGVSPCPSEARRISLICSFANVSSSSISRSRRREK